MVRNESEVIEIWVRYNLQVLDALIVIDHESVDNTFEILTALRNEGLSLYLFKWIDQQYSQAEAMIHHVRPFAERREAEFFLPLDGDELLVTTREALVEALGSLPIGHVGVAPWRTYLPEKGDAESFFFRSMYRYRSFESAGNVKVVAPADLLLQGMWSTGNHGFARTSDGVNFPAIKLPLFLAHYPVRSPEQLIVKVVLGALASRLKDPSRKFVGESFHWFEIEHRLNSFFNNDMLSGMKGDKTSTEKLHELLWDVALHYANPQSGESKHDQIVLTGPVPDVPDLEQKYSASPLTLQTVHELKLATEHKYSKHLSEVGFYEFNAGNAAWRENQWVSAFLRYRDASLLNPNLGQAKLGMARCLVKLGRWAEAREAFAACLRVDPNNFSAWLEAGHLCRQMGVGNQAVGAYRRAADVAPDRYESYFSLGRILPELGDPAGGREAFFQSLKLLQLSAKPDAALAEAAHRMGQYRLEQGDTHQAIEALKLALAATERVPSSAAAMDRPEEALSASARGYEIQIDLGEAYWRVDRKEDAYSAFTEASAATSEVTLARLGALSFRLNLWQEAIAVLQRNLELHPQSIHAHWNLAHLLAECWQMDEAEGVLQKAETLGPIEGATSLRAAMAGKRGDAQSALLLYQQCVNASEASGGFRSAVAMSALYCDHLSAQAVAQLHRELFASLGVGARERNSFRRAPLSGRKLRVGLVSADFHHQHPVNIFMQPILREYDRGALEVFVYFNGVSYDEQTRLAKQRVDQWIECSTLNDSQLAARIDMDQIDVLVDLAGHTGQQRMRLFAQRAAPVQVTYLGYPGSTGVPNIDWLIGDEVVTPKDHDSLYSERVWRLPGMVFCFAPEANYPEPQWTEAYRHRPLTFGSFNNVPKLTPRTLQLWSSVLRAVPDARLLLKAPSFTDPGAIRAFSKRFEGLGIDLSRISFRGPTGLSEMMSEYAEVDIALDPVPYNGGTTSLQALWMGVPVVVLRGPHFVSRMGASFMTAAGLHEWVAKDDEGYVRTAQLMAADRRKLFVLKKNLRNRLKSLSAWDAKQQTRSIQSAWGSMYRQALGADASR